MIFFGGGVTLSDTSDALRAIVQRLGVPTASTLMGLGCVAQDTKGYLGFAGMHGSYGANMAIQECDLLVCIGMRFSDRVTGRVAEFAPNAKIVHFELDIAEVNKNVAVDYRVLGDLRWSLPILLEKLQASKTDFAGKYAAWMEHVLAVGAEHPFSYQEDGDIIKPGALIRKISALSDDRTIAVTDVGQHQMWAAQFYRYKEPHQLLTSGGLGTMGYGLGAAIGAKMGCRDRTVINIAGDGCFRMNMNEIATASRYNIPVIEVVINNHVLGMVRQWQSLFYGKRFSQTSLADKVDFAKVAEGLGAKGYTVTTKEEFDAALKEAIKIDIPVVIDAQIDNNQLVFPMVAPGSSIQECFVETDLPS